MTRRLDPVTLTIDRGLLEHPRAVHVRRMRSAIWLYLALLARLPPRTDQLEESLSGLATEMGLPEGTIRSWFGHLRKQRYLEIRGRDGTKAEIRVRHVPRPSNEPPARRFSVAKLERALNETGNRDGLDAALDAHDDATIQRSLAGALAVPATEIRRSRTALFLYLLKRHAKDPTEDDPRH